MTQLPELAGLRRLLPPTDRAALREGRPLPALSFLRSRARALPVQRWVVPLGLALFGCAWVLRQRSFDGVAWASFGAALLAIWHYERRAHELRAALGALEPRAADVAPDEAWAHARRSDDNPLLGLGYRQRHALAQGDAGPALRHLGDLLRFLLPFGWALAASVAVAFATGHLLVLGAALVLGAWWPLAVARLRVRREELAGLPDAPGVSPATAAPAASVGTHEALERGPRDPGWFPTTPEEEMRGLARESGEELFSPPTWAELRRLEQGDAEPVLRRLRRRRRLLGTLGWLLPGALGAAGVFVLAKLLLALGTPGTADDAPPVAWVGLRFVFASALTAAALVHHCRRLDRRVERLQELAAGPSRATREA